MGGGSRGVEYDRLDLQLKTRLFWYLGAWGLALVRFGISSLLVLTASFSTVFSVYWFTNTPLFMFSSQCSLLLICLIYANNFSIWYDYIPGQNQIINR